jgi:hypothetical protein
MTTPEAPPLMLVSDTPPLAWLYAEFQRSGGLSNYSTGRDRNDRIRYNRWSGRTADYKKHREALGEDPIPWEDAWDGRLYTADGIIEKLGRVLKNAFRRAQFEMKPGSAQDIPRASNARKVMQKYRDRDAKALRAEANFAWQFALGYGASVWQCYWDRQAAMKLVDVSLAQITEAAVQAKAALDQLAKQQNNETDPGAGSAISNEQLAISNQQSALIEQLKDAANLPSRILDPAEEPALIEMVQTSAQQIAAQMFQGQRAQYGDQWLKNYELSKADARQVVRDLRTKGTAQFPAPYLHKNAPCVIAREVGVDYFCPPETTDLEAAPWHAVRDWMTPAQIMENKVTDGWDDAWCDAAVKTAGQTTDWGSTVMESDVELDDETQVYESAGRDSRSGLVEVIYQYARYVTKSGVPQIWCTVYCPHVMTKTGRARQSAISNQQSAISNPNDLYATHYPLSDSSSYGFFPYRWQTKRRNFHANIGIPELVGADQASMKRSLDMLVDRQDLEINPPWMVANRLAMRYKAGPGAQIPRRRPGDIEASPPPTGNPELAFMLIEDARFRLADYFGLMHEKVQPADWQTSLQCLASDYLESCEAMFKHYWRLIQKNADTEELARIAGEDPGFPTDPSELEGEFEVSMVFDVKDLDAEFLMKKLDAVTKMAVPLDRAGVIDLAQLVKLIVTAIDPTYASALIKDEQGASKAIFKDVSQEVLMMSAGNEADQVENDPTAGMKLKFLDTIINGNPKYQAKLGMIELPDVPVDPRFAELLTKYQENLQMSVTQDRNKEIGRTGVEPNEQEA